MLRTSLLIGTIAVLTIGTAYAVEPVPGARLGTTATEISTALGADGYDMTRYEKRADGITVWAIKEDRRIDLTVDATSGEVIAMGSRLRRGPDPRPGTGDDQIRASLAAQGYEVTKYERERGKIEVYASKDGRRYELKLDPRTGEILKIEDES
jgi:predicted small secreted protein